MVTVVRFGSLRVVIYPDDHDPPHVHVFGDGETKIVLGNGPDGVHVLYSVKTKKREQRDAVRAVYDNHTLLRQRWSEING
jgi:hypothetical protein